MDSQLTNIYDLDILTAGLYNNCCTTNQLGRIPEIGVRGIKSLRGESCVVSRGEINDAVGCPQPKPIN